MVPWKIALSAFCVLAATAAFAHDLPSQLPEPRSAREAWDVIRQSAANVDALLDAKLLAEVPFQLANAGAALAYLQSTADADARPIIEQAASRSLEVLLASREKTDALSATKSKWEACRKSLEALEAKYPKDVTHAAVYVCPMHPLDRHLKADETCSVCGMALVRRRLPASGVYEKPGEPTMVMKVSAAALVVGQRAAIKIRLTRRDGSPVSSADLVEIHTRKIHLLLNDASLGDYHHEHPEPTGIPGEYAFSFTPAKPGPYRAWADVVPAYSGAQEYVVADLPADTAAAPLVDRREVSSVVVDGRKYALAFVTDGKPLRAGQTVIGTLTITDVDGRPCNDLEPLMGAFAHVVGFGEDRKTVLHIHPGGRPPRGPDDRAGPAFAFKFYAPAPGFMRLYAQVQIAGVSHFVPFGVMILPAEQVTP